MPFSQALRVQFGLLNYGCGLTLYKEHPRTLLSSCVHASACLGLEHGNQTSCNLTSVAGSAG